LVDQFVNDAEKLDLNAFALGRGGCLVLGLNIESDNDRIGSARQQHI
jgi:hypothetical protein